MKYWTSPYPEEVALVLLDLIADVLVEEQLAEDEGAHGLHIQTLGLRQDVFVRPVDGSALLLLLQGGRKQVNVSSILASLEMKLQWSLRSDPLKGWTAGVSSKGNVVILLIGQRTGASPRPAAGGLTTLTLTKL